MKVYGRDFLYCTLCMGALFGLSGWITFLWLSPVFKNIFGDVGAIVSVLFFSSLFGMLAALTVRGMLHLFPLQEGEHGWDSPVATYWKLLTMLHYFGFRALFFFRIEPLVPLLNQLFGAKIGSNVAIGGVIDSPFLVEIGDDCILGNSSIISANVLVSGKLRIGAVKIGSGVTIGVFSMVMPNTKIHEGATLSPGTIVLPGTEIPSRETWRGNPARPWV